MPSPLNRRLLRPATGLLAAGVLGAGLGWLLTARGAPAGRLLANVAWLGIAPRLVWVLFVALIWAAVGTVRGATQPEAWPVSYAMGRWSCRIVVWAVSLGLLGAAIAWAWAGLRAPGAAGVPPLVNWLIVTVPVALAIFPATIGEIRAGRDMRDTSMRAIRWSFLRPLLAPAVAMVVALVLRLAAPRLRPLWQQVDWAGAGSAVGGWIARQLERLEKGIQTVMDDLYRRYYER
jgi:hypothetical protein